MGPKSIVTYLLLQLSCASSILLAEHVPIISKEEANVTPFKEAPADFTLFRKHPKLYEEFWRLKKLISGDKELSPEDALQNLQRRWDILNEIISLEPNFIAGYWLLGDTGIPYGSSFSEEKDLPFARSIFVKVEEVNRACLKLDKDNSNCKFFLGAAIGKISTIDGIFASLKRGKEILDHWLVVFDSPYNYKLDKGISTKGNVSIGLGMFYRLVPDFFLIRWFFDISGDIDKAIYYHKKGLEFDGQQRLDNTLNLACSLLCKSGGKKEDKDTIEANSLLDYLIRQKSNSTYFQSVIKGAAYVKENPKDACGYTIAKIQKTDEEEFKKVQNKK